MKGSRVFASARRHLAGVKGASNQRAKREVHLADEVRMPSVARPPCMRRVLEALFLQHSAEHAACVGGVGGGGSALVAR